MEERLALSYLSQILKRNAFKAFSKWKTRTVCLALASKYKKLKHYANKLIKSRQVPNITIQTASTKRFNTSSRLVKPQPLNAQSNSSSKIRVSRSNPKESKPAVLSIKHPSRLKHNQFSKPLTYKPVEPSEEIAVVSSISLVQHKMQNFVSS